MVDAAMEIHGSMSFLKTYGRIVHIVFQGISEEIIMKKSGNLRRCDETSMKLICCLVIILKLATVRV